MVHAAAELHGTHCRLTIVRPVVARFECDLATDHTDALRAFRRAHHLATVRVILWPRGDEAGVTSITDRPGEPLPLPGTLTIRERVLPLVRAGFFVSSVVQPHQVLAELALQRGAGLAIAVALQTDGGCLTFARQGRSSHRPAYLKWDARATPPVPGAADALARYQFAAGLAPHLRHLMQAVASDVRILVCGDLDDLARLVSPLDEECGRQLEVLDDPGWQLATAGASVSDS
jgi:hypothetical protein